MRVIKDTKYLSAYCFIFRDSSRWHLAMINHIRNCQKWGDQSPKRWNAARSRALTDHGPIPGHHTDIKGKKERPTALNHNESRAAEAGEGHWDKKLAWLAKRTGLLASTKELQHHLLPTGPGQQRTQQNWAMWPWIWICRPSQQGDHTEQNSLGMKKTSCTAKHCWHYLALRIKRTQRKTFKMEFGKQSPHQDKAHDLGHLPLQASQVQYQIPFKST